MKRIMFVCHGNICRSPMAEMIFKKLMADRGNPFSYTCASSATSTEEIICGVGNPIYPPAGRELIKNGIPVAEHRATRLTARDAEKYDMFIGMDARNVMNMRRILGEGAYDRIHLLLDFTGEGRDVADPWYSDRFDIAYRDIYNGVNSLIDYLTSNGEGVGAK